MSQEKVLDIGLIFDVLKNYKYGTKTEVFEKGTFTGVEFDRSNEAVVQTPEEFDKTKIGCSLDHTLYWITRAKEVGISGSGIVLVSTVLNKKDDKLEKVFLAMHALPVLKFEGKFIYPETSLMKSKVIEAQNARAVLQYAKNVWEPMAVKSAENQNIKIDKIEVWFYDPTNYAFIGVDINQFYKNLQEKGQLFETYIPRNEPTEPISILRESVAKHQQNILENFFGKTKRKLKESRVRKNPNGCSNVMQVAIQLAKEILEPIGFVKGESDDTFTIWRFENNRDFNFSIKTNFEIDNSFPTYERYQLVYEWIENGECNEQEVWVGGNVDELRNDFLDMASLIASDMENSLSDEDYQMGQIFESKKEK